MGLSFATRVPLLKADLCQHFTIVFFLLPFHFHFTNEALESDLIECFLLLSLFTVCVCVLFCRRRPTFFKRLLLRVSFEMGFYDVLECAMPANGTVPITHTHTYNVLYLDEFSYAPFLIRRFHFMHCFQRNLQLFLSILFLRLPLDGLKLCWAQYISHA